jgi:hypothetical protein
MKIDKALKLMARKGSRVAFHHKELEPKYVPREKGQIIWAIIPTQKASQKVQFPKKVAPKEENHQMLETKLEGGFVLLRQITIVPRTEYCKKVALFYQGKLQLCRGRNVRRWLCITKANRVCAADGM